MVAVPPNHVAVFKHAKRGAHTEAALELLTVAGLSAIPFFVGAFAYISINDSGREYIKRISQYLASIFLQGQLFLIAVSFMATSLHRLWNSDQSYRRPDVINVFAIVLFGIIGVYYGNNPEFAKLTSDVTRVISLIFFTLSMLFYYYTAVLAYDRPKPIEQALNAHAGELGTRVAARRKRAAESAADG